MNKAAIKKFAVEARKKLITSVKDKAALIGITKEDITKAISSGADYAVFPTQIGIETTLFGKELKQRENLVNRINEKGYESVMEEVAYTWFNRIIAIRFMEVNDYLPSRIRVLSSESKGKFEPDIVTQAPNIDLDLSQHEVEEIIAMKEQNQLDKLFRMLFIKQCNELGELLPELFENTSKDNRDYTEILLDISFTNEDGVIRDLLKIEEEDFLDAVEIIGWMYQYYNEERRDEVINIYKGEVKKEDIPAATQLFTTDWVVRYMVDNSLGKYWLERNPSSKIKEKLEYFLEGNISIVDERITPEDIKFLDPCMGSGHILVYAFDVLMAIYNECGYSQKDAAKLIIQKNLYGIDIDDRAYQLAYFAIMMRARKYNRKILREHVVPNLCSIQESDGLTTLEDSSEQPRVDDLYIEVTNYLIDVFRNAKEYGSLLNINPGNYDSLQYYIENLKKNSELNLFSATWNNKMTTVMPDLIKQAKILTEKYDIVVTNPPYLNKMDSKLKAFVNENFRNYSGDLFSAFMYRNFSFCKPKGYCAFMTPFVWMFIKTYEKLREFIINNKSISSLIQMEYCAFEEATVPVCTFVLKNARDDEKGIYIKLSDFRGGMEVQRQKVLEAILDKACGYAFVVSAESFSKIPGIPIAYWVSDKMLRAYLEGVSLKSIASPKAGLATGDNNLFQRLWYEVEFDKIGLGYLDVTETENGKHKWFPCNSGGEFRKWSTNDEYVVNWQYDGLVIKNYRNSNGKIASRPQNTNYYFKEGLTWNKLSSSKFAVKFKRSGYIFDDTSRSAFIEEESRLYYIIGFLCSSVAYEYLKFLNPTMSFTNGDLERLPIIINDYKKPEIDKLVKRNIQISKADWDRCETSMDFSKHPLIQAKGCISDAFEVWNQFAEQQYAVLKANEEELNRIFIDIYGLQDELTPEVDDKDVTIRKADLKRDIRSFISYAVGCMFGRYSLDVEGLAYAGGEWDARKYKTFIPDADNIIPITDEEIFEDDIVVRFAEFVKIVYGEETLEENLDFIATALGNKGKTSREIIRNYFLKDFYPDHVKIYQRRPIYWMFDSGKENGFKALIYLHRYNEDTVGRVRTDYLHKVQTVIENAIDRCDIVTESDASPSDKAKAVKRKEKLVKQLAETRLYDQAIAHIALKRIPLDLDDGVIVNYAKFQGIEVATEGKKPVKINLLGAI